MRHVRMLGLCLVAAFAIAAIAAVSASAATPEWGQCFEKTGGKYSDSNCQTKAKKGSGTFEWRKGPEVAHKKFTGEGGIGILNTLVREETESGPTEPIAVFVECKTETAHGEATGKSEVAHVIVKFFGCAGFGVIPCTNTGVEGEVEVEPLKGKLGYINKGKKEVGVVLNPQLKNGQFAQFICGGFLVTKVGVGNKKEKPYYPPKGGGDGIISPITPVNEMSATETQVYTANESDENIPNKFEGGKLQVLEALLHNGEEFGLWGPAGEEIENVNTAEEPVEIKA